MLTMVGTAMLADARELGVALLDLTDDAAVADVGLSTDDVIDVAASDGTVCREARLLRKRRTEGSPVFNVVLG